MSYRAIAFLSDAGSVFFGFCFLCGAAFVFMRSRGAALWTAIGGAAWTLCAAVEFVFSRGTTATLHGQTLRLFLTALGIVRHVGFYGAMILALRELARQRQAAP
jgi:hypothetical protein